MTSSLDPIDSSLRDLLSTLRASADADTFDVLAEALNVYLRAITRFRGQGSFSSADVRAVLTMWQMLLDVGKPQATDYSPRRQPTRAEGEGNYVKEEEQ